VQTALFIFMFYSVKTQFLMSLMLLEDFYPVLLQFHGTQGCWGPVYKVSVIFTQVVKDSQLIKEMRHF